MRTSEFLQISFLLSFSLIFNDAFTQEFGVTDKEVGAATNTGHNVQVWEILPEFSQKGNYEISIKHAAKGKTGSFYIIAWADTNNDGIPDTEIGRSELKTASADGEWSSWTFKSDYKKVFVGNTWDIADEKVYYQSGGTLNGYTGLSNIVFYSREFNGKPTQSTSPRYTNIKIKAIEIENTILGITKKEVTVALNTGHNVQVWEVLPEFSQKGNYEISIKHAAKGKTGSFYIIAWADTNNDGIPDTEIGRSELKTASFEEEWSSWTFKSDYKRVFVGNTWDISDEKMYYQSGGKVDGYTGLSNIVFYSREFNGKPTQSTSPRYTNIKVRNIK